MATHPRPNAFVDGPPLARVVLTEALVGIVTSILSSLGYVGLFVLMALESMIAPVPSELVMPFAGFLVADGKMTFGAALFAAAAGSLVGSLASYAMGVYLGRPAIVRFGRYLLLREEHLTMTETWFHRRRGGTTVLLCRFVPVVRHLISIPAGMGRMPLPSFVAFTVIGATAWDGILLYVGVALRERWSDVAAWFALLDYAIVLGLVAVAVAWVVTRLRKTKKDEGVPIAIRSARKRLP